MQGNRGDHGSLFSCFDHAVLHQRPFIEGEPQNRLSLTDTRFRAYWNKMERFFGGPPLSRSRWRSCLVFVFFLLLLPSPRPECRADPLPTIFLVNSYHQTHPWVAAHNQAFRAALQSRVHIEIFDMDTKRLPKTEHNAQAACAMEKYNELQPDIVVLCDDNALRHLGRKIAAQGTPVVYLGINANPRDSLPGNDLPITGVLERPLLKRSILYLQQIQKKSLQRCLVLLDDSPTSRSIFQDIFYNTSKHDFSGVQTDILLCNDWDTWLNTASTASQQGYDLIITGLYHTLQNSQGAPIDSEKAISEIANRCSVPLFGIWDFNIGPGKAVGGLVLSSAPQGERAAQIVADILRGRDIHSILPTTTTRGELFFSRSGLRKWGLQLPPALRAKVSFTD